MWRRLRAGTRAEAEDIGTLLRYVSEYIIRQELVRVRHKSWAETIRRHIEEHVDRRISLADLGRLIGKSPSFVAHHFAAEFGATPRRYLQVRRMEAAREGLESGLQVQQVAERLGFYDAFHFSKRFKAHWGRPPSAFKP
jgi:AraC-like DNA-binding protein